jgi:hypothetical protein
LGDFAESLQRSVAQDKHNKCRHAVRFRPEPIYFLSAGTALLIAPPLANRKLSLSQHVIRRFGRANGTKRACSLSKLTEMPSVMSSAERCIRVKEAKARSGSMEKGDDIRATETVEHRILKSEKRHTRSRGRTIFKSGRRTRNVNPIWTCMRRQTGKSPHCPRHLSATGS